MQKTGGLPRKNAKHELLYKIVERIECWQNTNNEDFSDDENMRCAEECIMDVMKIAQCEKGTETLPETRRGIGIESSKRIMRR